MRADHRPHGGGRRMGGLNRNFDYLHIHDNVRRRVRNLEVGVHPTGSNLRYYDSFGPTPITLISPGTTYWQADTWRWQRRVGIVTMTGGLDRKSGSPAWSGNVKIGVLPAEARPQTDLVVVIPASRPDFGDPRPRT